MMIFISSYRRFKLCTYQITNSLIILIIIITATALEQLNDATTSLTVIQPYWIIATDISPYQLSEGKGGVSGKLTVLRAVF